MINMIDGHEYKEMDKKDIQKVYDMLVNAYKFNICKARFFDDYREQKEKIHVYLYLQEDIDSCPVRIIIDGFFCPILNKGKKEYRLYTSFFEIFNYDNQDWNSSIKAFNEAIEYDTLKDIRVHEANHLLFYLELLLDLHNE